MSQDGRHVTLQGICHALSILLFLPLDRCTLGIYFFIECCAFWSSARPVHCNQMCTDSVHALPLLPSTSAVIRCMLCHFYRVYSNGSKGHRHSMASSQELILCMLYRFSLCIAVITDLFVLIFIILGDLFLLVLIYISYSFMFILIQVFCDD